MLKRRAKLLDRRVFFDGQQIFAEGEKGDVVFLVEEGEVRLSQNAGTENEVAIATVGRDSLFGEMALFDDRPRMATATAVGTTTVVAVAKNDFDRKLARLDGDTRKLFELLIGYCRKTHIYAERKNSPETAEETELDGLVRSALNSPQVSEATRQPDRFLAALFSILAMYAKRRLPPV